MRRWLTHFWVVAVLIVLPGLRVLCSETCEPGAAVSRSDTHDTSPSCHDETAAGRSDHEHTPAPDDEGCSHGDTSSTSSLQAHQKPVRDVGADLTFPVALHATIERPADLLAAFSHTWPLIDDLTLGVFSVPLRR